LRKKLTESIDETDLSKDYIMRKHHRKHFPWFTLDGFKSFAELYKCEESTIIRKYYESN